MPASPPAHHCLTDTPPPPSPLSSGTLSCLIHIRWRHTGWEWQHLRANLLRGFMDVYIWWTVSGREGGGGGVVPRHPRERTIIPLIFPAWLLLQASGLTVSLRTPGRPRGKAARKTFSGPLYGVTDPPKRLFFSHKPPHMRLRRCCPSLCW